ncbi:unnamed protein product, partial [Symbiodinium sp. KB8]
GGSSALSPRASQREIEGVEWKRALAFQHESSVFALPARLASAGVDAHATQHATASILRDFLDMTQVLDLESHFEEALATLPDPDKKQVEKAFHRLDGADINTTAVSSAKWAFIRAELRVASTVAALVQPEVLKALHAAMVGPAEDVAAVERLAGLMAGIMVETPEALLGKIEQGWTQAPEGVREGAWTELLGDYMRPALLREQFSAALGRMTAEGEGGMSRALRHLSAVDRERVEKALERLDDEDANIVAAGLDVESVVALLQPGMLGAAYKALLGSVEDAAGLERFREFLKCWMRTKATRLVSAGRTTRRLKPEGVSEEVWSKLLKNYLFPAVQHAVFEGAVAYMAEDGEWRFMATVRRLPKRDRNRVRDAFARLDGANVDKSALTCVKWAFTSATGEVNVAPLLSALNKRALALTKTSLESMAGDFVALQELVTGLQSSIAPGSISHAAGRWPPIHRGARPRRGGTREDADQVPLLELHKVCNVGIPLHHLLVGGKDSIRGLATAPARVHRAYEDVAVALEDRDSSDIKDSFVWLRNLFGNFIPGDVCEWQVLRVLRNPAEFSSASPGDDCAPWSPGCRPVMINGMVAAVVLRLPVVDGMPFGLDKSNVQCFEPPFEVPVIPLGYGSGSGAAAGQVMQQRLGFTEFVLTPQRAEFFARAFATCMGKDQGVLATSGEGTGKTECLRAIATIVTIGLGGDAFVLPSAWRASRSSEAEGVTEALLHGLFSLSGGGALADERISSVLLGAGEGYLEDDAVQAILGLQTGFFGSPREGQLHPTPRLLLVDDAHELHGDYLQHKEAASAARRRSLDSLFLWDSTSCKVLAYKPDVRSFEFPDEEDRGSSFSFAFDAGSENPVVDLGTFSNPLAEHLLLLEDQQPGEGAANAAAGAGAACSTQHATQATVACMALPENIRVLVGGSDDFKGKLTQLVARVGGEPRVLLRLLGALKRSEHADAEKAFKVASELVADIIKERSRSLKRHLVEWLGSQAGGDARLPLKNLLQLVADATAPSPQFPYLRGFTESPFRGSDLAFGVATHAMLSLSGEVSCGASQDHLDDMWAGKVVEGNAPIVADLFESQVGVLLYMGLFGGLYVNLTGQAEELDLHEAWASGSFFEGMQAVALSERILERLGSTKDSSGIDQSHVAMLHGLKVNQVLLIHTQRNFPGVDFLAFKWVKRGERVVLQVAFVEATTSTLPDHAGKRSLKVVER